MDSDDEDVTESDILDWYKSEVQDLWTQSTETAFGDLSSNLTEMFRQVMNDVKHRNQPRDTSTVPDSDTNGHSSSVSNGIHSLELNSAAQLQPLNTVSAHLSSEQLMAMLQDDENWLEEDTSKPPSQEEQILSVHLTDKLLEDDENINGVR